MPLLLLLSLTLSLSLPHPSTSIRPLPDPNHISDLKRYLHRFGYLPKPDTNDTADFKSAISLYQINHSLKVTGELDPQTLAQISSPRCGVPDRIHNTNNNTDSASSKFAYFSGKPRWTRPNPITLTYALSPTNTISYIDHNDMESVIKRAFDRWASVIPVKFVPAGDYDTADVKLGFYSGDHGDGEPFDGVLGILAHAFSPESGRLHLDAAERWAVDFGNEKSKVAIDLESVATHEIGHVLGLGHSTVKEAVMYPSLSPRTKKVDLTVDDVEGVQVLYGSNPNFKISSLLESDTSSSALRLVIGRWPWSCIGILLILWILDFLNYIEFDTEMEGVHLR